MIEIQDIIGRAMGEGRILLTEVESKNLLRNAGIPVVETRLAKSKEEAESIAVEIGFPVVLKIVSPDIVHKTDTGGVRLGISTAEDVRKTYDDIMATVAQKAPQATVHGVSVQRMLPQGTEVIIGMKRDAQFGPVIMFGLGGILVEIIKDVSFRIAPLTRADAREMIREIKALPLLTGYRNRPAVDISKLEDMLLGLSSFSEKVEDVEEIDLNPVFAYPRDAVAVDARIVLKRS